MLTLYKIYKEGDNNFYIGSTENMYDRKRQHKSDCKIEDFKIYKYIRANGGWNNWKMEKIGECYGLGGEIKCIKKMKPSLNTIMYVYADRKEYMKNYMKKLHLYKSSWGGDVRRNNNLLNINPNLFN